VDEAFSNLVREIRKYNKVRSVPFLWHLLKLNLTFFSLSRNNRPDDQPCPTPPSLQECTAHRVVRMTTLAVVVAVVSFFSLGSTSDICREVAFFVMSHSCLVFLDLFRLLLSVRPRPSPHLYMFFLSLSSFSFVVGSSVENVICQYGFFEYHYSRSGAQKMDKGQRVAWNDDGRKAPGWGESAVHI